MSTNKYQLSLLIAVCLIFANIYTKAYAQSQTAPTQGSIGSAGSGYDYSPLTPVNPDSDQPGENPYAPNAGPQNGQGLQRVGMPINRNPSSDYIGTVPGDIPGVPNGIPLITPSSNLPYRAATALANSSQRNLTPINPQLTVEPRTGLPPTVLDSFVRESGMSDAIYGDEGTTYIPPYNGFGPGHRISKGFKGQTKVGLTTGHGSKLPSAWGGDEYHGNEHSVSGPNYVSLPINTTNIGPPAQSLVTN